MVMNPEQWQPSASLEVLRARAALLQTLRAFFAQRAVMEVETPLLCAGAGTDPQLAPIPVSLQGAAGHYYLQTSPEFAMKRLLAAGSGPIYQIGKAFRDGDQGRRHNPEFTMLEWYRPGFSLQQLMDEVEALVGQVLEIEAIPRHSYRALFARHLDIDPHQAGVPELRNAAHRHMEIEAGAEDRDFWLDLLYSHVIEPRLEGACFIHDYPASQAALASLAEDESGTTVAQRFELVVGGMEVANGYHELCDPREQARRFSADARKRAAAGKPAVTVDRYLLQALESGLPPCSGVALGLDRLLMLKLGLQDITAVLSFDFSRA